MVENETKSCREVEREKGLKGTEIYSIENKKGIMMNEQKIFQELQAHTGICDDVLNIIVEMIKPKRFQEGEIIFGEYDIPEGKVIKRTEKSLIINYIHKEYDIDCKEYEEEMNDEERDDGVYVYKIEPFDNIFRVVNLNGEDYKTREIYFDKEGNEYIDYHEKFGEEGFDADNYDEEYKYLYASEEKIFDMMV